MVDGGEEPEQARAVQPGALDALVLVGFAVLGGDVVDRGHFSVSR